MCALSKCRSILSLQMCITGGLGIPGSARERTTCRNVLVSKAWLHMWYQHGFLKKLSSFAYKYRPNSWLVKAVLFTSLPTTWKPETARSGFKHSNKGLCEQGLHFRGQMSHLIYLMLFFFRFGFCDIQNNQGLGSGSDLSRPWLFRLSQKPHLIIVYCRPGKRISFEIVFMVVLID